MSYKELYKVIVQFRPEGDQEYEDPVFVKQSHACLKDFRARFGAKADSIQQNAAAPSPDAYPWVDQIAAIFANKAQVLEVGDWMGREAASLLPNRDWMIQAPASPGSIAHALWVRIEGEVGHIEDKETATPLRCKKCGWHDFSAAPEPLEIPSSDLPGQRDIFLAMRGLLIVSKPVLTALEELTSGDFDSGEAQVRGRSGAAGKLHWIRPRHQTGNYPSQRGVGARCSVCGLPEKFDNGLMAATIPGAEVVQSFGETRGNIAWIGRDPQLAERDPSQPLIRHDLAISGGLFAALVNMGFKGLTWPAWGPLISLDPKEATWEPTRRFADRASAKEDKFMKKKVSDWRD